MVKRKFLRNIQKLDVNIGVICTSKDSAETQLRKDPDRFYKYVMVENIMTLLVDDYLKNDIYNTIHFTIDQSLSKKQIKSFNEYCEEKISYKAYLKNPEMKIHTTIRHEDSKEIPMLQVADYIASATQRKITQQDSTYYDMISEKIKYRKTWDLNDKISW